MSNITETLAKEVVDAFRTGLDEAVRAEIGPNRFQNLEDLVSEALAVALKHAADQVEMLSRSLRGESAEGADGMEL
ncbi:MAG: hypothetical protein WAK53_06895 [Chromatiaceae bacterium]|jgi:hypothetical protein